MEGNRVMCSNQNYPLFSVIIPTYNSEKYLVTTIESALFQTYPNIEIIVIDDGSTDFTKKVIEPYLNRIQYYIISHSGLPAVARNFGLSKAKGKYIAFLDSDDIWLPNKLSTQYAIFQKNVNIGLISTNAFSFDDEITNDTNLEDHNIFDTNQYPSKIYQFKDILINNFIITSSVVISQDCLSNGLFFSEEKRFRAIEDYHLWLRIALKYRIFYINEPLLHYRVRTNSIRSEQSIFMSYEKMICVYSDLLQYIKLNFPTNYDDIQKISRQQLFIIKEFTKYCILHRNLSQILKLGLHYFTGL